MLVVISVAKLEPDPDGSAQTQPAWVTVLTDKMQQVVDERARTTAAGDTSSVKPSPPTKGRLACFIACCVRGKILCSRQERLAILEVRLDGRSRLN
jgi:hypothetical protein